jgi:hypothetical protein
VLLARRQTLMLLGWLGSLPLLLQSTRALSGPEVAAARAAQLRALIRHPSLARAIGRSYRTQFPEEADATTLTHLLWLDLGLPDAPGPQTGAAGREQLLAALDARVRAQFGAGQTVVMQGWLLARTEARLCALCE